VVNLSPVQQEKSEEVTMESCCLSWNRQIEVVDVAQREPDAGEVLIRSATVASAVPTWRHSTPACTEPGLVIGHEFSEPLPSWEPGCGLARGDRVIVNDAIPCGECSCCREGRWMRASLTKIGVT